MVKKLIFFIAFNLALLNARESGIDDNKHESIETSSIIQRRAKSEQVHREAEQGAHFSHKKIRYNKPELQREIFDRKRIEKSLQDTLDIFTKCLVIGGCIVFDKLTQMYLDDTNFIGLYIAATNAMFSESIERYLGKDFREKTNHGLLIAGVCLAPKVTITAYLLNSAINKVAGSQVSASVLSCVAMNNAMKTYLRTSPQYDYSINASMIIATASSLMPDLVEQVLGNSYREKFMQAVFVAGICLAPEITIGSYAIAYTLNYVAGKYIKENSTAKKVFSYFCSRAGGIAGKLAFLYW